MENQSPDSPDKKVDFPQNSSFSPSGVKIRALEEPVGETAKKLINEIVEDETGE
jgi:hypothetical protein